MSALSCCVVTQPFSFWSLVMKFFLLLELTFRWKKRVFASPSERFVILEHYLLHSRSRIARPIILFFSLERGANSSSDRVRDSCAMSSWRMTDCAIWNWSFAFEDSFLLHFLKASAVLASLKFRRCAGFVWVFVEDQASWTTCLKPGIESQKFSNLKYRGHGGLSWLDSSNRQWSDSKVDRACSTWDEKVKSQASLQKTRSRWTKIGLQRSLLQVNFLFCRWLSLSLQVFRVSRKLHMLLRFKFESFLSLAL